MHDCRYPNLKWVGDGGFGDGGPSLPVSRDAEDMMRALAKRVCRAIPGVRAAYCTKRKDIGFYYRNPGDGTTAGAVARPVYGPMGELNRWDRKADSIIRLLYLGRVPRKVKDAWARCEAEREQSQQKAAQKAAMHERLDAAMERLPYRRGTRKTYAARIS